jgi:hypothetical protein
LNVLVHKRFFGIEECILFLNKWNVIAFTLSDILALCDAFLLPNQMEVWGGLMCCVSVVNFHSFQNLPVTNLHLLMVFNIWRQFLKKEPD